MHLKIKHIISGAGLMLCFAVTQVMAVPILVDEWMAANSGDDTEKVDVRTAIVDYNVANDPDLPQLFGPGDSPALLAGWVTYVAKTTSVGGYVTGDGGSTTLNWTAPGDYDFYYIMTKWGQGQGEFDHALHYLAAGELLSYSPGGSGPPNGLSHLAIWGSGQRQNVPDGGATLMLLGLGLILTHWFSRRVRA